MAREAEKIRSINTPGWDGVNSSADVTRIHNVLSDSPLRATQGESRQSHAH